MCVCVGPLFVALSDDDASDRAFFIGTVFIYLFICFNPRTISGYDTCQQKLLRQEVVLEVLRLPGVLQPLFRDFAARLPQGRKGRAFRLVAEGQPAQMLDERWQLVYIKFNLHGFLLSGTYKNISSFFLYKYFYMCYCNIAGRELHEKLFIKGSYSDTESGWMV